MFRENDWYGHSRAIGRYAGFDVAPPMWGYLQHGWHPGDGFAPYRPPNLVRPLVWNSANEINARATGLSVTPIGAPFLYLLQCSPPVERATAGTIVYPFHSWERGDAVGDHEAFAREIAERETGPTTVCLYWLDFERETVRRTYEQTGARVICHGTRNSPEFLEVQLRELLGHRRLVTNRVSTALWYGGAAGLEIEVYGPSMGLGGQEEGKAFDRFQRERWSELFGGTLRDARPLAQRELGAEHVLDKGTLAEVLGWRGWKRLGGPALRLVVGAAQLLRSRLTKAPAR